MASIEQSRAKVVAGVWQAVAQSGVNLSALPREQQDTLVSAIADQMLLTLDDLMQSDSPTVAMAAASLPPSSTAEAPRSDANDEQAIWEGRPFLNPFVRYMITNQRVRIWSGIVGKDVEDIELIRIQDLDTSQGVTERLLGIGDLVISSADTTAPTVTLNNIRDPNNVRELLRKAWLAARERYRLQFREQM